MKHYSIRTKESYENWVRRFILFHNKMHLREMKKYHVEQFLTHLAVHQKVAASTQNQALSAILYRHVLCLELKMWGVPRNLLFCHEMRFLEFLM